MREIENRDCATVCLQFPRAYVCALWMWFQLIFYFSIELSFVFSPFFAVDVVGVVVAVDFLYLFCFVLAKSSSDSIVFSTGFGQYAVAIIAAIAFRSHFACNIVFIVWP